MNNFLYIKPEEFRIYLNNLENEVFDVTIPVRYLIKKDNKTDYSSVLFLHIPKTKIIGFTNPIYKSKVPPCILIR